MKKYHFIISFGMAIFFGIMVFAIFSFEKSVSYGYDFANPTVQWSLPDTLREISGITLIDESRIACVQDENGIVFEYDMQENDIVAQKAFHMDGDYEGIARVGSTVYVLRSDGMLFEVRRFNSDKPVIDSIATNIPVDNSEGLCYDAEHHRLLIACKNKLKNTAVKSNTRFIYAYDLKKKQCSEEPVLTIALDDIKTFAQTQNVPFPRRTKKHATEASEEPMVRFRPSEIAIHPVNKRLFLLSAVDHALFIFSPEGELLHIELLNTELFNKAEGIAFLDNGDLLISNEGQENKPSLLRFNYRKEG